MRAHRAALQAQRVFWQVLLHDAVAFTSLQASFKLMSAAERAAASVYRRALERYPSNGEGGSVVWCGVVWCGGVVVV